MELREKYITKSSYESSVIRKIIARIENCTHRMLNLESECDINYDPLMQTRYISR